MTLSWVHLFLWSQDSMGCETQRRGGQQMKNEPSDRETAERGEKHVVSCALMQTKAFQSNEICSCTLCLLH